MSLLDKASLIQIPSGYKNGKLYSVKPTPTYGSELVTNGDFSGGTTNWLSPDYNSTLSIVSGQMKIVSTISLGRVMQGITTVVGKKYLATATITNIDSSTGIQLKLSNGSNLDGAFFDSSFNTTTNAVTITHEFTATATTTYIGSSHGTSIGQSALLDNVSVKEITNIGDFDFSRSSSGTRVNSEGLIETASVLGGELVTNGDFNTNSNWFLASGATISDGKLNLNVGSGNGAYQVVTFTAQTTSRVFVVCSEYVSGSLQVRAGTTTNTDLITAVGTYTFYLPYASYNYVNFFSSGGFEGKIDSITVKELIGNDVPRLDYSDGSCASLLLEPQRTNLVTHSSDFSQWNRVQNTTLSTDSTVKNVDGTNSTKLTKNSTSVSIVSDDGISISASTNYVFSFFVKKGNYDTLKAEVGSGSNNVIVLYTFSTDSFSTSESGTQTITSVSSLSFANEWKRISIVFNGTITSINTTLFIGENTNDYVYYYGAQLEQGSYATSYIPTNGSTVTRTADVCNNAGTSATFNSTEGVLFAEIKPISEGVSISLSDGTISNRVAFYYQNGIDIRGNIRIANSQVNISGGGNISDAYHKIALRWDDDTNILTFYKDGSLVGSVSYSGSLGANTLNNISFTQGDGTSSNFYGKCKQLMVFDEALSDEQLSDLTGQVNLSFNNLATFYNYTIL